MKLTEIIKNLVTNFNAHAASADNPHGVTAAQAGADPAGSAAGVQTNLDTYAARTDNPHGVTAAQVGLGSVNNTADADKPVSAAQAAAIAVGGPKRNIAAVDPGQSNDETEGYAEWSLWMNSTTGDLFVCADATESLADWVKTT